MLRKKITYTDYDGNVQTEEFFFNLNKVELTELRVSEKGGLEKKLSQIVESNDEKEILKIFKEIILLSVGQKSLDGKRFIKSQQIRDEFEQSEAFVELFSELMENAEVGAAFVNGLIPESLSKN